MNLILRGVVLILWALFLTACQAPLPKSSMDKGPTKSLSQKADEIYALALKENSYRMLDRARYLYEQALLAAPASVSLQYKTYLVYYRLIILGEQKHHSSAKAIYASLPSSLKKELAPPSYAKLILARRIGVRDEPYYKSLMQDVVAEQPKFAQGHVELAQYWQSKKEWLLALAMYKQAHRIEEQNLVIQAKLGFAYANYANAKTCRYSDLSPTRKAVQFLQTGHQLEKGNPYIHAELADLYGLMGMYPLSLREARKAYSMDSNPYFTYSLVVSLVDSGRLEESLQYYNKLPEQKADMIMEMFYRHAAVGKWQQAITYRDRYLAKGKVDNLYDALMIDIVTKKLNADIAQQYSYEQLVASLQLTPWEHTVNQFWLGQMDAAGLISEATDVCMTAEAEFYMGAKAYLSGDHQQAVTHFEKVLATKTYNFVEFALAKQLLKEL